MNVNNLRRISHAIQSYFTKKKRFEITVSQYRFRVPADLAWAYSDGDYYEKNVIFFLDQIVKSYKRPVMVDVGANCGYYTLRYAGLCSRIFAIEPVSRTYQLLTANIRRNSIKDVQALKMGLSDHAGKAAVKLYNSSGNNSIFERNVPEGHSLKKIGEESIQLDTLDHLIQVGKISAPDIIKIDVEGAELQVLKGAAETISKYRPTLLLEYSENTSNDAGYNKADLLKLLKLDNYNVYGIPENENDFSLVKEHDLSAQAVANLIFIAAENDVYFDGRG